MLEISKNHDISVTISPKDIVPECLDNCNERDKQEDTKIPTTNQKERIQAHLIVNVDMRAFTFYHHRHLFRHPVTNYGIAFGVLQTENLA